MPRQWRGRALGADASITLYGPADWAEPLLRQTEQILRDVDDLFSLFNPTSSLTQLNATASASIDDDRFHRLLDAVDAVHAATDGLFDPTVQTLWRALAENGDSMAARETIGWQRVRRNGKSVTLAAAQSLTLNGIAQGFATDLIAEHFEAAGATSILVNIGEHRGVGGPWRLGVSDPQLGPVLERSLTNRAMATSSPAALLLAGGNAHILDPLTGRPPVWSTVSVEADSATLADGLSTAFCHADLRTITRIAGSMTEVKRVTLIDADGDIATI